MHLSNIRNRELVALLKLSAPLIVNNLSLSGIQFADAVMAGRLGAQALAAVSVGSSVWFLFFMVALGLMMAISPIVARHTGAGTLHLIGKYTQQGLLLGVCLGVPTILLAHFAVPHFLGFLGIDPSFRLATERYVAAISWGAPAMFMFLALRFTNEGLGHTQPIMVTSLIALCCNVLLNWVFIYGKLGAPALGAVGCGVASAISMWIIFLVLLSYMLQTTRYRRCAIFEPSMAFSAPTMKEILLLGSPIAVTVAAEAGLFNAVSLLMGTLGADVAAAHLVALNFASTTFMIPLAIAAGTTVRVGFWLGSGNLEQARSAGYLGISTCTGIMMISATILVIASDQIVAFYTQDSNVAGIAATLLLTAAIFQVADGLQVGAAGALRGYKDTQFPMIMTTFAYWAVGFPLAFFSAVVWRLEPKYVWGGFVGGLCLAAILLGSRYWFLTRAPSASNR